MTTYIFSLSLWREKGHDNKRKTMTRQLTTLVGLIIVCLSASAQIFSPNANDRLLIEGDSIYLFKNINEAKLIATGSNTVKWFFIEPNGNTTSLEPSKETDGQSELTLSQEGRYKATITTEQTTNEYSAWCFSPKIDSVRMEIDSVTCNGLYAQSKAYGKSITMNINGKEHEIKQKMIYQWFIDDTLALTTNLELVELGTPMSDGELRVVALNQAERERATSDSVSSWGVSAKFEHKVREHDIPHEVTKGDAISAPSEIEFTNKSLGDYTVCEWQMGEVARLFDESPVYSFQTSGKYKVTLTVTNENSGCSSVDSTLEVTITESEINFPNVFTPNGDEVNDEFRPSYKSIKSYNISIYNRWGRKIYQSDDITKGWDGKNGNSQCAEGVYMYVAEAEGFDKDVRFTRKGSVTLVR